MYYGLKTASANDINYGQNMNLRMYCKSIFFSFALNLFLSLFLFFFSIVFAQTDTHTHTHTHTMISRPLQPFTNQYAGLGREKRNKSTSEHVGSVTVSEYYVLQQQLSSFHS